MCSAYLCLCPSEDDRETASTDLCIQVFGVLAEGCLRDHEVSCPVFFLVGHVVTHGHPKFRMVLLHFDSNCQEPKPLIPELTRPTASIARPHADSVVAKIPQAVPESSRRFYVQLCRAHSRLIKPFCAKMLCAGGRAATEGPAACGAETGEAPRNPCCFFFL